MNGNRTPNECKCTPLRRCRATNEKCATFPLECGWLRSTAADRWRRRHISHPLVRWPKQILRKMEQEFVSASHILYQFISTVELSEFESRRCGKMMRGPDGDGTGDSEADENSLLAFSLIPTSTPTCSNVLRPRIKPSPGPSSP
jgi:hypothetical protein